jgi:hypothetical protein
MDLRDARVVLRERRLLDVLDLSIRFLVSHAAPYAALAAIVLVPCGVLSLVIAVHSGWALGWFVAIVLATFAEIPFTVLGSRLVFTPEISLETVLTLSLKKTPRVLIARFLQAFSILAGLTIMLLPGVWVAVTTVFLTEIIVLEEATVGAAFSRAQRMLNSRFGDALMVALLISGLHAGAVWLGDRALATVFVDLFQITPPPKLGEPGGGVLGLCAYWLFVPYAATARLFAYLDLRTRSEGWDVQVRFAALAHERERDQ